jgi:hypothetical protein
VISSVIGCHIAAIQLCDDLSRSLDMTLAEA